MTHYDEFGVAPTASLDEIQRAHRNLARLLHPDHIQDEQARRVAEGQLKRLNAIYHVLIDPERRRAYDLQLMRLLPVPAAAALGRPLPPSRPPGRWLLWAAFAAAACLAAGFQLGSWKDSGNRLGSAGGDAAGPGSPLAIGTAQAAAPTPNQKPGDRQGSEGSLRQLAEENRELRRALHQATIERDQALSRLAASRPFFASAPIPSSAAAQPPPASAVAEAAPHPPKSETRGVGVPLSPAPSSPTTAAAAPSAAPPRYSGTWIYSPPGGRHAPGDQYPAEYIEVVLMERDETLWGRYRARYKVADRALNPEVEFFFEGKPRGHANRFVWTGNGGAKGEVSLKLLSDSTMSLDWFTSQLGRGLTLGSGSAVLVRRDDR